MLRVIGQEFPESVSELDWVDDLQSLNYYVEKLQGTTPENNLLAVLDILKQLQNRCGRMHENIIREYKDQSVQTSKY